MTTWLALAAIVLAALSVVLFVLALRRLLTRQADVTEAMLRRYDDRLAGFAQTLNDALSSMQTARPVPALELESDPEPMVRALELARERTAADGAIALVSGTKGVPIVATVGLSESETNHIARMGFPDYRGARAIEVGFAGDLVAPEGEEPVRSGLVMPLLDEEGPQSLLGVLTRDRDRRFSEEDVDSLHDLVQRARESEPVQQPDSERYQPRPALRPARVARARAHDFAGYEHDAQRNDRFHRWGRNTDPAEGRRAQRDTVRHRERGDGGDDAPGSFHQQEERGHEQQVIDTAPNVLDAEE